MQSFLQTLAPHRPLLLVDADEVVLQFIDALDLFLQPRGYELKLTKFALTGNIFNRDTGIPVTDTAVSQLVKDFFARDTHDLDVVPGAAATLHKLSRDWQIAFLTNIPAEFQKQRIANLHAHGLPYPVIANSGGKGPAVRELQQCVTAPTAFIDDLPPQHTSVMKHAPDTFRIHYVAHETLRRIAPPAEDAHVSLTSWSQIYTALGQQIP